MYICTTVFLGSLYSLYYIQMSVHVHVHNHTYIQYVYTMYIFVLATTMPGCKLRPPWSWYAPVWGRWMIEGLQTEPWMHSHSAQLTAGKKWSMLWVVPGICVNSVLVTYNSVLSSTMDRTNPVKIMQYRCLPQLHIITIESGSPPTVTVICTCTLYHKVQ